MPGYPVQTIHSTLLVVQTVRTQIPFRTYGGSTYLAPFHPISRTPMVLLVSQEGTVAHNQIISAGGCNSTLNPSPSCAQQISYVETVGSSSVIAPQPCPPPRYRPALVPNMNSFSSSFANQVFVVSGLYNTSLWNDGGTINEGEIVSPSSDSLARLFRM